LQSGLDALRQWLMWQGVNAAVSVRSASADIASTVIAQAADWRVDLIVMGAYGHSRWTESVLGGATRGLLTSMTVPVLMSH
jgi:nucleotide-binding universal stress UspA family protein